MRDDAEWGRVQQWEGIDPAFTVFPQCVRRAHGSCDARAGYIYCKCECHEMLRLAYLHIRTLV